MAARQSTRAPRKTRQRHPSRAAQPPKPEVQNDPEAAADLRDRAADVVEGARWAGAQEATALLQAAEHEVRQIRRAAAADAERVLLEAADEAGDRLRVAAADADATRAGARAEVMTILGQARADAEKQAQDVVAEAESEAKALLADAETQVGMVLAEAEDRAASLVDLRRTTAEAAYRTALDDAVRIVGEAQDQAVQVKAARAALDSELELTRRSAKLGLEEELAARRAEIDAELAQHRARLSAARAEIESGFRDLTAQHERERQALRDRLAAESARLRKEAEQTARVAAGTVRQEADGKLAEAHTELEAAREAHRVADKRAAGLKKARNRAEVVKQASIWVALTAVIILTASGEWAFARMVGLGDTPIGDAGWALPLGLDVYAVTAFRMRKDVPFALGLMAATNITYHVADRTGAGVTVVHGEARPNVLLIVVAVIVVVAIVWRVHRLLETDHDHAEATAAPLPAEAGVPVAPLPVTAAGSPVATGTGNPGPTATGKRASTATGKARPTGAGNRGRARGGSSGRSSSGNAEKRAAVRARASEILAAGQSPSPTALAAEFGIADTEWVRNQIRAVR